MKFFPQILYSQIELKLESLKWMKWIKLTPSLTADLTIFHETLYPMKNQLISPGEEPTKFV